jgi:hypothetical protein
MPGGVKAPCQLATWRRAHIRDIGSITLAIAACVVALAACGSSSKPGGPAVSAGGTPGVEFADCMRTHGVQDFPDPSAGGGFDFQSSGVNPSSPAFESAQRTCAKYAPVAPALNRRLSAAQDQRLLSLSRCMRAHGVPSFPDPTPSKPIAAKQATLRLDPSSPGFQKAAATCGAPGLFYKAGQAAAPVR